MSLITGTTDVPPARWRGHGGPWTRCLSLRRTVPSFASQPQDAGIKAIIDRIIGAVD